MFAYCLYCLGSRRGMAAAALAQGLGCRVLIPRQAVRVWSKTERRYVTAEREWLPNYLFAYTEDGPLDAFRLQQADGVSRCLRYADGACALRGADLAFAMMLLARDGMTGPVRALNEGGTLRLPEDAFAGVSASIVKVNRRAGRMLVALSVAGQEIRTWMEYETDPA